MDDNGTDHEHPKSFKFYCRDCKSEFDSVADSSGYEQARCLKCNEICMTVAFEKEEQDRNYNQANFFSFLGSVTGLFHLHVPNRPQPRDPSELVAIANYEDRLGAENDMKLLASEGIEASIDVTVAGSPGWFGAPNQPVIELKVPISDVVHANEVLNESTPRALREVKQCTPVEDVTFSCEECGKTITFPAHRRGRVETCPHCLEYVDVPD